MAKPVTTEAYTNEDFSQGPFIAFYEVTRACDLLCRHCRACAQPKLHPHELTTTQSKQLLDQFASFPKPPVLVFTGGDPMKRNDIFELIEHAVDAGLSVAMTPSATPLMTKDAVSRMQQAGLSRLALSIDGADAATHDAFRGVSGSFARTLEIFSYAREIGLPIQINTTITQRNVGQIDAMAELFAEIGIVLWSVFFLIPVGRGTAEERIPAWQYEQVFSSLWNHARRQPYGIKTTEAHHYRRYVLQQQGDPQRQPDAPPHHIGNGHPGNGHPSNGHPTNAHAPGGPPSNGSSAPRIQRAPLGVNDGKGVMFVSHTGVVQPSGFMPINCGKFPKQSIIDIYQNSPTFQQLRDPDLLRGKCGVCEYRGICGGSRARAYAVTRDPVGAEPDCVYIPAALEALNHDQYQQSLV